MSAADIAGWPGRQLELIQLIMDLGPGMRDIPPPPGIYERVDAEVYHRWAAVSQSWLNQVPRSMAHVLARIQEKYKDSPALMLGRAIHHAVLEPELFEERYHRGPDGPLSKNPQKKEWDALKAEFGRQYALTPEEHDICLGIQASCESSKSARTILQARGLSEMSMVWIDPKTGLPCKGRIDRLATLPSDLGLAIVDPKSTVDAQPRAFEKSIFNFGYHIQGAMYTRGIRESSVDVRRFIIVAMEKSPPYAINLYNVMKMALEAGEEQLDQRLALFLQCLEAGHWPSYDDQMNDAFLPDWAWGVMDNELAQGKTLIDRMEK